MKSTDLSRAQHRRDTRVLHWPTLAPNENSLHGPKGGSGGSIGHRPSEVRADLATDGFPLLRRPATYPDPGLWSKGWSLLIRRADSHNEENNNDR
jgi:hypothetical protein